MVSLLRISCYFCWLHCGPELHVFSFLFCICRPLHLRSPLRPLSAKLQGWCQILRCFLEATAAASRLSVAVASLRPPELRTHPLTTPSQTPPPAAQTSSFVGRTRLRLLTAYMSGTTPADRSRFHRACRFLRALTRHPFRPNRTRFGDKILNHVDPTSFPDPAPFLGKSHSSNAAPLTPTPPFALLHLTSLGLRL